MYKVRLKHRCEDCGQILTDPDSIDRGHGPTCWAKKEQKNKEPELYYWHPEWEPHFSWSHCQAHHIKEDVRCPEGHLGGARYDVVLVDALWGVDLDVDCPYGPSEELWDDVVSICCDCFEELFHEAGLVV
tara:strand:- start:2289 stop:2678 length:390 start_codon:yes stop_codon:yes gene_type:complete